MPIAVRADEGPFMLALKKAATTLRKIYKPRSSAMPVPGDATTIGPGYMMVWATEKRVHMRFRGSPQVTVMFDRKAASEFGEWLTALPKESGT